MRYPKKSHRLPIRQPAPSTELAEFVGIMIGDGGLSAYQATVSLNQVTDAEYSSYVAHLMERLFGVTPSVFDRTNDLLRSIVVSRIELVHYLNRLGLPIGNKVRQSLDIPFWIQKDPEFKIACLRGLVDTDGSIFTHTYAVKGKTYAYKKLSFTSASPPLLATVCASFESLGLKPRIGSNKDVRLDSKADMERYFEVIGTNNPKHLRRYRF